MNPLLGRSMKIPKFFIFWNSAGKKKHNPKPQRKSQVLWEEERKGNIKMDFSFQALSRGFFWAEVHFFELSVLFSYLMAAYICAVLGIFVIFHRGLFLPETSEGLRGAVCISHWINFFLLYLVFPAGVSNVYICCSLSCAFSVQKCWIGLSALAF